MTEKQLEELAKQKRNEYMRENRKKNPEKIKQYQDSYWKRRAIKELKQQQGQ